MSGKFEDVQEIKKPTKKIENLLAEKGSYASEFYCQGNEEFVKTINQEFTKKLLEDFDSYVLDPINKLLIVFFVYNKDGEERQQKMYYFNPEGFTPPDKIKNSHLKNLTTVVIKDYESFKGTVPKSIKNLEVGFHFYSL
jgi:hypothetical protein